MLLVFTTLTGAALNALLAGVRSAYPYMNVELRAPCKRAATQFEGDVAGIIVESPDKFGIAAAWKQRFPQIRVYEMPVTQEPDGGQKTEEPGSDVTSESGVVPNTEDGKQVVVPDPDAVTDPAAAQDLTPPTNKPKSGGGKKTG